MQTARIYCALVFALHGCSLVLDRDEFRLAEDGSVDRGDDMDAGADADTDRDEDGADSSDGADADDAADVRVDTDADTGTDGDVPPPFACPAGEFLCRPDSDADERCTSDPVPCIRFRKVVTSEKHACGLHAGAGGDLLYCWGENDNGETFRAFVGGNRSSRLLDVELPTLARWQPADGVVRPVRAIDVAVTEEATCFLSDDPEGTVGRAYCVGDTRDRLLGGERDSNALRAVHVCQSAGEDCTPAPDFVRLASRPRGFCGMTGGGDVWCWGINDERQAGASAGEFVVATRAFQAGVSSSEEMALSNDATCLLLDTGTIQCFGAPAELGRDADVSTAGDVLAPGDGDELLTGVTQLAAGPSQFCAIYGDDDSLACWGQNANGLISGDSERFERPVQLLDNSDTSITGASQVAILGTVLCYWTSEGEAQCRGTPFRNEVGTGASADALVDSPARFARVPPLDGLTSIEGRATFCGARSTGDVVCWGYAPFGQVPHDSFVLETPTPVVPPEGGVLQNVSISADGMCAVIEVGDVSRAFCTGHIRDNMRASETDLRPFNGLEAVAGGSEDVRETMRAPRGACAVSSDQTRCWGVNENATLGLEGSPRGEVETAPDLMGVRAISVGNTHGCALFEPGSEVRCWGRDVEGQLLREGDSALPEPIQIDGTPLTGTSVSVGRNFTCAVSNRLSESGQVLCWGLNSSGQLGNTPDGDGVARPELSALANATEVRSGNAHTCAISDGRVYCWGQNRSRSNGHADMTPAVAMLEPEPGEFATSVALSVNTTCAGTSGGAVYCWGSNEFSALGQGEGSEIVLSQRSVIVPGFTGSPGGFRVYSNSEAHSFCAGPAEDGRFYCWGRNPFGMLGIASGIFVDLPTPE
ncbi:MAG: hypothetical protein AAF411_01620 [Myxococcota bacterium]